jgi:hypothetical protein
LRCTVPAWTSLGSIRLPSPSGQVRARLSGSPGGQVLSKCRHQWGEVGTQREDESHGTHAEPSQGRTGSDTHELSRHLQG